MVVWKLSGPNGPGVMPESAVPTLIPPSRGYRGKSRCVDTRTICRALGPELRPCTTMAPAGEHRGLGQGWRVCRNPHAAFTVPGLGWCRPEPVRFSGCLPSPGMQPVLTLRGVAGGECGSDMRVVSLPFAMPDPKPSFGSRGWLQRACQFSAKPLRAAAENQRDRHVWRPAP